MLLSGLVARLGRIVRLIIIGKTGLKMGKTGLRMRIRNDEIVLVIFISMVTIGLLYF